MHKFLLSFLAVVALLGGSFLNTYADIDLEADFIPPFHIGSTEYAFAYSDESDVMRLWEFLPQGQRLEAWNSLASLMQYKFEVPVAKLGEMMVELVKAQSGNIVGMKKDGEDMLLMAFVLHDENNRFSEINIWRYKQFQGTTLGHQLAFRYYGDNHKEEAQWSVKNNMKQWIQDLKQAAFPRVADLMLLQR